MMDRLKQANVESQQTEREPAGADQFERLLEEYGYDQPKRGQVLKGHVLRIQDDAIFVDVGLKRDALIPSRDLERLEDEVLETLEVGDEVPLYVTRTPVGDQQLVVSLNRGYAHEQWQDAKEDLGNDTLLELEIVGENKGGLLVKYKSLRGFVPNSHIPALRRVNDKARERQIKKDMIGGTLPVKIIEVDDRRQRLVLSARAARREYRKERLEELEVGQVIEGQVVNVVDFGIFVDLGGVDGLVHKSKIDWQRVDKPREHFEIGDEVQVKVIDVDPERERVSLSRRAMLPNPWDELEEKYSAGDLVEVTVTSVLDFGAFAEMPEGVEGLIPASESGYLGTGDPDDELKPGERVLVKVLEINADRERITLSMRRVTEGEQISWIAEEAAAEEAQGEPAASEAQAESEAAQIEEAQAQAEPAPEPGEAEEAGEESEEEPEPEPMAEAEQATQAESEGQDVEAEAQDPEEGEDEAPEEEAG